MPENMQPQDLSDLPPEERQKFSKLFEALNVGKPGEAKKLDTSSEQSEETQSNATGAAPELPKYDDEQISKLCPRCGFNTALKVAEPTEEDKQNYLRSLLGDIPFEKDYKLYNGAMTITLRAKTV